MLQEAEIDRSDRVLPSRANASKNLHFLRVVASLPARGLGDGVRKGLQRVGGAMIKDKGGNVDVQKNAISVVLARA